MKIAGALSTLNDAAQQYLQSSLPLQGQSEKALVKVLGLKL